MKKVLLVAPSNLPIPAVKGGAVETGINQLLDENEKQNDIEIDVISYYDEEAYSKSKYYKSSSFYFYKPVFFDSVTSTIIRGINKLFRIVGIKKSYNIRPFFTRFICKIVKTRRYDAILIKNAINYVLPVSKYTSNNLFLQLHNDFLNNETPNATNIVNKCKYIITNSNYIRKRVLSIPASRNKKILVNMNCLDNYSFLQADNNKRREIMEKYNIKDDEKIILFSGRIVKEKGIKELLYAVKEIKQNKNWKLLIAGSKWFSSNKKDEFIKELEKISNDISDNIIFLGYVPHSEISYYNSIADVVIIPSIWEEPAGRVALEAAAVGTPVIVSDSGGLKEYINPKLSKIVKRNSNFVKNLANSINEVLFCSKEKTRKEKDELISFAKKYNTKRYYNEIMRYMKIMEE